MDGAALARYARDGYLVVEGAFSPAAVGAVVRPSLEVAQSVPAQSVPAPAAAEPAGAEGPQRRRNPFSP